MQKWCYDHSINPKSTTKLISSMWAKKCFKTFANVVSDARREGDKDKDKQIIAQTMKLLGNCAYGFTITNKEKYCSVKYVNEEKVSKQINDRFFKDLNELNNDMYEVIKTKSKVVEFTSSNWVCCVPVGKVENAPVQIRLHRSIHCPQGLSVL